MQNLSNRQKERKQEETDRQVRQLLAERGSKALEQVRNEILQEKIESKEAQEALAYFINEYWLDLARPTLFSLSCEAVGGDQGIATRVAVPMILISGAIDIHDDIVDKSRVKQSRPTVLGKFGTDMALIVGDMLMVKGFTQLCQIIKEAVPAEKATAVTKTVQKMFLELGDAEALELRFRGRIEVTPEEYLGLVKKKAADVEAYTRIGAILGNASKEEIEVLGGYGRILGMMAILRDDLTDMTNLKEITNRIKRECLPLPVIYALANPDTRSRLCSILAKKVIKKKDAETILAIASKTSGIKRFENLMQSLAEQAYNYSKKIKRNSKYFVLMIDSLLLDIT